MHDIKRKAPFFLSDFKDSLSLQCLASVLFLYCACMSPVITFGGLLGEATQNRIVSTKERLVVPRLLLDLLRKLSMCIFLTCSCLIQRVYPTVFELPPLTALTQFGGAQVNRRCRV